MADDKAKPAAVAADDKGSGTAIDRLLKGLDVMATKIDSFTTRMDSIEAKVDKATKRADADAPPPAGEDKPKPPVPGEGEPVPPAADKAAVPSTKVADADPAAGMAPVGAAPGAPAAPAADALPPQFVKKPGEGEDPDDKDKPKADAADSVGDLNALRKRLARLEASMSTRPNHDLAADQARADSIYSLFGESAPRPLLGDSRASYVLRSLEKFKVHSPAWKDIDLTPISVDEKVLDIAADQIYGAARAAASSPANVPSGTLRAITTRTPTGHIETRFMGSPSAWMNRHAPNRRFVTAINLMKGE